jgi:Flp pilus assembly protein TadD
MRLPRSWQFSLLLFILVVVIFLPVCGYDFLYYDDRLNVRDNPLIRDFSLRSLWRFWRHPFEGLYIPLTYTVWGMLAILGGGGPTLDPAPFHAANLILHVATVMVVFSLFRHLVRDYWGAAAGALFFGLHPLVVEPVVWISELKGILSGFFSVMALLMYEYYCKSSAGGESRTSYRHYLLATMFYAAAVLSKPVALVLPLLVGLLFYCGRPQRTRELITDMVPWLVLGLPVAIITKYAQPSSQLPFVPEYWERVLVGGDALFFYFSKLLWPFNLGPDYGRIPSLVLAGKWILLTGLLPWFLLALLITRKAWPWHAVVGIPLAYLLPVLGFIPFTFQGTSTVADRYFYLGLIGPALGVAMLLARHRGRFARLVAVTGLTALAVSSSLQLRHWQDTPTLKWHILKVNPNSWIAHHNLGMYYREQNQLDRAVEHYKKAIRNKPTFYLSYFNLGYVDFLRDDLDGAIENYGKVVRMKPDFIPAYSNLGVVYQKKGLTAEAIGIFEKSVAVDPDFPEGYLALGRLYALTNRKVDAAVAYRKTLVLKPEAVVFHEYGLLCLELGRLEEAEAAFGQAQELGYDSAAGLARLAEARRVPTLFEPVGP